MHQVISILFTAILLAQVNGKYNVNKILKSFEAQHEIKPIEFSWQNCGPSSDIFMINTLSVQPDPLRLPGVISINIDASLNNNITGPLTLALKIIKTVGPVKFEIPCIDNFGSCTYSDLCAILPSSNNDCPDFFKQNNVPCACPFVLGEYMAKNLQLEVDLPEKIPPGKYNVVGNFQNSLIGHIGCLNIELNLS